MFVVLASYLFLAEKPTRRSLVGTAIGLAGMIIISGDGLKNMEAGMIGNALAILGAVSVVGYFIVGRSLRARLSLLAYVTPLYGVCCLFLLAWAILAGNRVHPYGATEWVYFAALAVVPTIFGHTVFNWAIKHVKPTAISIAFLGEPVVAALLAFVIFSQRPPVATFAGGALVLVGIYLTTSTRRASPVRDSKSGII
jgi:drug/metabolite transporter (DMT)-like permease